MSSESRALDGSAVKANDFVKFNEKLILPLLALAVMIVVMNSTMFNLALPSVSTELRLSATTASWIVTGYSIIFSISSITYSRLSDFIPLRTLVVVGLIFLGAASLVGFFSHQFILLLLARLFQAFGAGSVLSLSLVLLSRYVPAEQRGKAMAYIISFASLGFGLGPLIGGVILQYLGWSYLFLITCLILLLIPVLWANLPAETPKKGSFDAIGAILIAVGTTGVLLFLTLHSLTALIIGVVTLTLFGFRINYTKDPFVKPSLFRNKPYMLVLLIGVASYMINFASLFLMPQILVHLYGYSAVEVGFIIFPGAILAVVASKKIGSILDQRGNRAILRFAPYLLLVSCLLLALFATYSPFAILAIYIPLNLCVSAISAAVSNELSRLLTPADTGAGMGFNQLAQFLSGAFTVALVGSAMDLQSKLPLTESYSNLFWGACVIALVCTLLMVVYYRRKGQNLTSN